ncbi:isopentenyl-diphosphate Delta-isomerase [Brenneria tiliae]|uniref:Isopentenyl-diphosphate delta-isomerase n=1 Tax=Brenneria tiliae TaxID=2914984 RepID=A0ABT0MNK1_9GAMM|nr:isopentenyl-diphosphate Delta-isomerase [Brenneria tiliae]MCL2891419.1 isopentenyl-diphosphate Delta-isomerase [Brenneria tiliae]
MGYVTLVDENDTVIGKIDKIKAHLSSIYLHRAFSCYVINSKNEIYIQKRAWSKLLWPGYWSNSYCSHPNPDEDVFHAVIRRAEEELSVKIRTKPIFLYKFQYIERYKDIGFENELCYVFIVFTDAPPIVNSEEILTGFFIHIDKVQEFINSNEDSCTPWFKREWGEIKKNHWSKIKKNGNS